MERGRKALAVPFFVLLLVAILGHLTITNAWAQLPITRLDGIYPAGGMPGKTVELSVFGADLDDVAQLQFSHAGLTAAQKMAPPGPFDPGPQPVENRFVVTVRPDVPPGHYNVRCIGKFGLSNARTFAVSALESNLETEPNNELKDANECKLPSVIDGQLGTGADQDWFRFTGQAGQKLLVEGLSRRIDSRAELQITILAPDGRLVAESESARTGDPALNVTLPVAGVYSLRIRDTLFGGGNEYPYRITLSAAPSIDYIFPPAGLPGSNDEYTIYGSNLPGGQPVATNNSRPLEQLKVRVAIPGDILGRIVFSERIEPYQFALDGVEYRVTSPQGVSNPVLVTAAAAPVVREQDNNNAPAVAQKLVPPCEVAGQFYPQRDVDWYTFDAKAGEILSIEIWSHRLNASTDPSFVIQQVTKNDKGEEQVTVVATVDDVDLRYGGREFDQRSYDPAYRFTAPADGTYRLLVRDGYSQLHNDPKLVYRLAIRPPQPDFRLVAVPVDASGAVLLRKGGREAIRVIAARRDGFNGEITINVAGLPAGVTAPQVVLGPANFATTVVLSADANAAAGTGAIQISGKAVIGGAEVTRVAKAGAALDPLPFNQPTNEIASSRARITDVIPVTVSGSETSRLVLTMGDGKVLETARGGVLKIPYSLIRQEGTGGSLTGFPIGLPPNVGLPQIAIGGNNAGDFELRLQANTPPGTYSFYLAGMAQGANYIRNPEAAVKAKERQDQMAKTLTETQQKSQAAQVAAQQAATLLTTATNETATATQARATADQAVVTTAAALKAADQALAAATQQSAAKPDDAALKEKVVASKKAMEEAALKVKMATDAAKVAETKLTEAMAKQKAAQEAKDKADKDSQAAQQLTQLATQEKQRLDQRAALLQQQSALRAYNWNIPSTPVTIKIDEYPIRLTGSPERLNVKQGGMAEIPFKVERLYGFNTDVNLQFVPAAGLAGAASPNVALPANQTDSKLVLAAQANATPGEHKSLLRVTMNFNGQPLTFDRPIVIAIEKVEAQAK